MQGSGADRIDIKTLYFMTERDRQMLEWLHHQRDYMCQLLTDYEAGRRKIGRIENDRQIDETSEAIDDLKQRIAQIGLLIAEF